MIERVWQLQQHVTLLVGEEIYIPQPKDITYLPAIEVGKDDISGLVSPQSGGPGEIGWFQYDPHKLMTITQVLRDPYDDEHLNTHLLGFLPYEPIAIGRIRYIAPSAAVFRIEQFGDWPLIKLLCNQVMTDKVVREAIRLADNYRRTSIFKGSLLNGPTVEVAISYTTDLLNILVDARALYVKLPQGAGWSEYWSFRYEGTHALRFFTSYELDDGSVGTQHFEVVGSLAEKEERWTAVKVESGADYDEEKYPTIFEDLFQDIQEALA